jgi:hypothetical protein
MPNIKIVPTFDDINLYAQWSLASKFHCKDRLVDGKGNKVDAQYHGRLYQIVEKRERQFSHLERLKRGLLGITAVVCSLGLALISQDVRELFSRRKETLRFAIPVSNSENTRPVPPVDEKVRKTADPVVRSAEPKPVAPSPVEPKTDSATQDESVYKDAKPILRGTYLEPGLFLNFAVVAKGEKKQLIPVLGDNRTTFWKYKGSALEALLKIAQDKEPNISAGYPDRHDGSPIGFFLKHPDNTCIKEDEFLRFIQDKDGSGTPRICTLNAESTLEVLQLIKQKNVQINLNEKTPTGETLFTLWAGKRQTEITKILLELDSSLIQQIRGSAESPYVRSVLRHSKEADLLYDAMAGAGMKLTEEEEWVRRAYKNDNQFSDDEFTKLDIDLRKKIFYIANAYANEKMVGRLKSLGMNESPLFLPGPGIHAENMDIITAREVMESFLKRLRKDRVLLTEEEFLKLGPEKYIKKGDQIGRILGKEFIEKIVAENGLKHIKVPKKIAVISEDKKAIGFKLDGLEIRPSDAHVKIYAERVHSVERKLSLEEAIEFMIVLEKTGFNDFGGVNFFFCEDGVYFIDTEYTNFSPENPHFGAIGHIADFLEQKDVDAFSAEFEKRKKAFEEDRKVCETKQAAYASAFKDTYKHLARGYSHYPFVFNLDALLV